VGGEFIRNQVLLRTDFASDISPVLCDRIQLQQVILNLLMNAIEATNARSDGPREILLTSQKQGPAEIVVAISDSGAGIDAATLDRVFDPFFTTKPGGMGMGLSISRSLVEAHGGRLWAIPNQRGGARFQFSLPV
jgi:signal transduction histidine kinase